MTKLRQLWQKTPYHVATLTYLVIHLGTIAAVAVAMMFSHHGLVHHLSTWDGAWFLKAVYFGYPDHLTYVDGFATASPIAFFPLMPLLLRGGHDITQLSPEVVGLTLSFLTGLTATWGVGRVAAAYRDADTGVKAALLFALTPGAFTFNLIYAEGILLTCLTYGMVALREKKWWRAGLLGAVASTASPVAAVYCVVTAFVAVREWRAHQSARGLIPLLLSPLGGVSWVLYLWLHTGTPLAWTETERGGWQSYPSVKYPFEILWAFLHNPLAPTLTGHILFFGTVTALIGLWWCYRVRLAAELLVFATTAIVLFAISQPVGLRPRFLMLTFPLVIGAASLPTRWYRIVGIASSVVMLLFLYEELTSFAVFP